MTRPVAIKKADWTRVEDAAIRLAQKMERAGLHGYMAEVTQDGVARIIPAESPSKKPSGLKKWE